jgi:hypothetical protein
MMGIQKMGNWVGNFHYPVAENFSGTRMGLIAGCRKLAPAEFGDWRREGFSRRRREIPRLKKIR